MSPLATAGDFLGLPIIVSYRMPTRREQWRRPRSRSMRIRRKWAKDQRNWREVEVYPNGFIMGGTLYMSPKAHWRMMRELAGARELAGVIS